MATNKDALNRAHPATFADQMRQLEVGNVFRALSCHVFNKHPAAGNPYAGATLEAYTAPTDAKVLSVAYCYARAGTGTKGPVTYQATLPPGAGEYCISSSGDVVFNASDAWTAIDLIYHPYKGEPVELTLSVVSHVATIPTAYTTRGVLLLEEVESLAGALQAKMLVMAAGATPTTGQAALALTKSSVVFAAADAVTQCRVKLLVAPATDVDEFLRSTNTSI